MAQPTAANLTGLPGTAFLSARAAAQVVKVLGVEAVLRGIAAVTPERASEALGRRAIP